MNTQPKTVALYIALLLSLLFQPDVQATSATSKNRGGAPPMAGLTKDRSLLTQRLALVKSADVQLTNGVTLNNQSVALETWNFYSITVPAGMSNVIFTTTNATDDVDIYVQATNKPTFDIYACAPYLNIGNETCIMDDPAPGTWWLGVYGYTAATYSVQATFSTTTPTRNVTPSATSGGTISPATIQAVALGATTTFTVTPNAGYLVGMGGTCGGSLTGNLYTTKPILDHCTVIASFALPIQLTSGVTLNGQSVEVDAWKYYKITVPAGTRTLTFATSNATSDVDIYTHQGNLPPTINDYDCRPYTVSGNEECDLPNPLPGTWWVGVYGWEGGNYSLTGTASTQPLSHRVTPSATSGGTISPATVQTVVYGAATTFTVTPATGYTTFNVGGTCGGTLVGNLYTTAPIIDHCTVIANFVGVTQLTSGGAINNQSVALEAWKYYKITVPAGTRSLTVATTNATADVDLYVRQGSLPDGDHFDCAPYTYSGNESCVTGDPTPNTWWIGVYGWEAGSFAIKATLSTVPLPPVNRTVTPSASSGGTISPATVQTVVNGATKVFTVTPATGYVAWMDGTCGGTLVGTTYTTLAVNSDCTVVANFTTFTQLTSGVILNSQSVVDSGWKYYKITVAAGTQSLTLATTNATGDVDIYVRQGNLPDEETHDCAPYTYSGNESCVMVNPTAGVWWLGVHGYAAGSFSVKATISTAAVSYRVTPSASAGGTISPATVQTVVHGAIKVFTLTPATGYAVGVSGTCNGTLIGNTYTTYPIVANCTVAASFSAPVQLTSGVTLNGQSVALGAWKYYKITVPANAVSVDFATSNATADIDLYIRSGVAPTEDAYTCAPTTDSGNESCLIPAPTTGIWWLGVYGYAASSFSVTATVATAPVVDFTVTSITFTPAAPVANGTFTATVTVKNQGTVSGDGKFLDVWSHKPDSQTCGATIEKQQTVGTLAAGATKVLTFTGLAAGTAGMKMFRAFVDSDCSTEEANEYNNQKTVPYAVNQATGIDFVVSAITFTPAALTAGTGFSVAVTVKNQGTVAGDGKFLDIWGNSYQTSSQVCGAMGDKEQAVGVLAAGASKVLTFTFNGMQTGSPGLKMFRAFVDSTCATAEANEGNNQKTVLYPVNQATGIDFVVTAVTLTPTIPTVNGTFAAAVTVKNQGTVAADGNYLDVWSNQSAGQICNATSNKRLAIGIVAAGATKVLTVTGLPSGTAGAKTLRTFVDSDCSTAEANEGNNQFTKSYTVN